MTAHQARHTIITFAEVLAHRMLTVCAQQYTLLDILQSSHTLEKDALLPMLWHADCLWAATSCAFTSPILDICCPESTHRHA